MQNHASDPWLLTPGPLTTAPEVKQAMNRDLGSRDAEFVALSERVRERLLDVANGRDTHVCVPLQGSGTFVVEAMLGTFVPADGEVLILVNGAYGRRMVDICERMGRRWQMLETCEDAPIDVVALDRLLTRESQITHVAVVHCETTTGIRNPLEAIADVVASHCRSLLVDAMSAFGALPVDARRMPFDALVASSNKCLEGVPGVGFCLARRHALEAAAGNSPSVCLDLFDQWQALERNGQWRFTPPTHCLLAFDRALDAFIAEGGVAGRAARYGENCRVLVEGMQALGFEPLLADDLQAPVIVTFHVPADPRFDFEAFYTRLKALGFVIYPGKLTGADTFRMGCIGHLTGAEMRGALEAVRKVLRGLGVESGAPERSAA
jgi:2-aminoethylphosphonate-pyruvate transaminase